MHPDEAQTPEEQLEQAYIAESGEEQPPLDLEPSSARDELATGEDAEVQGNSEPLPELKLEESGDRPAEETPPPSNTETPAAPLPDSDGDAEIADLEQQKQALWAEIQTLKQQKESLLAEQTTEVRETLARLVREGLQELEQRKQELQVSVEQLERRRERIQREMRTSFAGVSQDMAIRVQGFKDYLVGSLQDLAAAAEQLELPDLEPRKVRRDAPPSGRSQSDAAPSPQFAKQSFQEQRQQIRTLLDRYRTRPDYYGPSWQLRRTFEPIHAERVQNWFFSQGGRGSMRSMGSRLQNILVASAAISVLHSLYGDRLRVLAIANTPERLGEWRRGLQDCLGISRSDFGPSRGVALFESAQALVQKAERLVENKYLPLIVIDETEDQIDLSLLQFPLWLAFAPDPSQASSYMY